MRYRIYFRDDKMKEDDWPVREVEADGLAYRICDDHGHVVFGEPWPKKPRFTPSVSGREPGYYN